MQSELESNWNMAEASPKEFKIAILEGTYAICQMSADSKLPNPPSKASFWSWTRTEHETSLVCRQDAAPSDCIQECGWRMLYLDAQMDLDIVGILATLLAPLREAGISIFAISTFDTDYIMVREENLERAISVLRNSGYEFSS